MRDINFRGKDMKTNKWVYGDLIQLHDNRKYIVNNKFGVCIDDKGNFINTENPFVCEVIPETVGQCINKKDRDNNIVHEHDVLDLYGTLYMVYWDEEMNDFCLIGQRKDLFLFQVDTEETNIIGNKFDNSELVKDIE